MATRNLESPCCHLHCYFNSENDSTYSVLSCLPSPYVFLFTNDSKRPHIQMNYSGGPNIVYCEQCMLSSCLTPQYNICSFVVLQRPPYLTVPVTVNAYWYDNYGLAILQQLQDLMRSRRFVGLLILGISALIVAITCHCGSDILDSTSTYCSICQ